MRIYLVAISLLGVVLACDEAFAACLRADVAGQTAEGRLRTYRLPPSGKKTGPRQRYIVTLRVPACLDSEARTSRTIEIYSLDSATREKMRRLAGKTVIVRGTPRLPSRAHHEAKIIMTVEEIRARRRIATSPSIAPNGMAEFQAPKGVGVRAGSRQ
jgi:hypothetical protein